MEKQNIDLKIRGHIKVTSNSQGVLFDDHNEISPQALETIIKSLTQLNGEASVDTIRASGSFQPIDRSISEVVYTNDAIIFRVIFYEFDFDGIITDLELNSNSLGTQLASRTGLNISKDNASRLQIDWKIQITLN